MRYTGGLLGGTWITALTGDLGAGKFDGAWLVSNFENLNPSNTYWTKAYNLYSKIDTEAPRFSSSSSGGAACSSQCRGDAVHRRQAFCREQARHRRTSAARWNGDRPAQHSHAIVVFCSKGDNITPPQQALGWILDLYGSVDDIRAHGQTIVYSVTKTSAI